MENKKLECNFKNCKYNLNDYCSDTQKFENCEYQKVLSNYIKEQLVVGGIYTIKRHQCSSYVYLGQNNNYEFIFFNLVGDEIDTIKRYLTEAFKNVDELLRHRVVYKDKTWFLKRINSFLGTVDESELNRMLNIYNEFGTSFELK